MSTQAPTAGFTCISRAEWGAKLGRGNLAPGPKARVVIHHAPERATSETAAMAAEIAQIRIIEADHGKRLTPTNPRIGYDWIVAPSTRIYEGCGWDRIGAHVADHNTASLGILLMMDGRMGRGSDAIWEAVRSIILEGIRRRSLVERPEIATHRQYVSTNCPGALIHSHVQDLRRAGFPGPPRQAMVGRRVHSSLHGYIVVTEYRADSDWEFVPVAELKDLKGIRAGTPLSAMPVGPSL